jgi:hypothetical protein
MQNENIEIIDISDKIHEILYQITKLVNGPQDIDQRILKDFIGKERTQTVKLIKGNQVCEGELLTLSPYSMGIKPLDKDFKLLRNDTILVQIQHPAYDQQFIIQTVVTKEFASWANTECQDPRYDKRYNFRLQNDIELLELPHLFYDLVNKREVHIIREILHHTVNEENHTHHYKENIYSHIPADTANPSKTSLGPQHFHPDYTRILATSPLRADFRDISQGGICILLDEEFYDNKNLLLVRFETPLVSNINPALSCDPLTFNLLGSIRGFGTIGRKYSLHIKFLKSLEDDHLDDTLRKLEKYYKSTGNPL